MSSDEMNTSLKSSTLTCGTSFVPVVVVVVDVAKNAENASSLAVGTATTVGGGGATSSDATSGSDTVTLRSAAEMVANRSGDDAADDGVTQDISRCLIETYNYIIRPVLNYTTGRK